MRASRRFAWTSAKAVAHSSACHGPNLRRPPAPGSERSLRHQDRPRLECASKGYVMRFRVARSFLDRYRVQEAGGKTHLEYWIPAEDLDAFNDALVGEIEVLAEFG